MNYLGTRLKYLRKLDNVTQQQLATALGIAKSTISMYENGQREPDFETLEAISDFFNVDIRTFFPGNEKPSSVSAEGLSDIKRELIEKIYAMDDETVAALNRIADQVLSLRDK